MRDIIYDAICEFVFKNYGEEPEESCYDLDELAKEISERLKEEGI